MGKKISEFLILLLLITAFSTTSNLLVFGDKPIVASRISTILEISVIIYDTNYIKPNKTLFRIDVIEEILIRSAESQVVVESADCYPKALIYASFVNQSYKLEPIAGCLDAVTSFTYQPNITVEYESIMFRINQSSLPHLPDGNYTLYRSINTASEFGNGEEAEVLLTSIQVTSGVFNITYPSFTDLPIPEELSPTTTLSYSLLVILPLFLSIVVLKKKYKKESLRYSLFFKLT